MWDATSRNMHFKFDTIKKGSVGYPNSSNQAGYRTLNQKYESQ